MPPEEFIGRPLHHLETDNRQHETSQDRAHRGDERKPSQHCQGYHLLIDELNDVGMEQVEGITGIPYEQEPPGKLNSAFQGKQAHHDRDRGKPLENEPAIAAHMLSTR